MNNWFLNIKTATLILLVLMVVACGLNSQNAPQINQNKGGQIGDYVIEIFEDSEQNLWFGTLDRGVAMYNGKTLKYFTNWDGLPGNFVCAIEEDIEGNLWFGTKAGLSKYDGEAFTNYNETHGLCNNQIANLLIDKTGKLWIGTWNGFCTFNGEEFTEFTVPKPDIDVPIYQETTNWSTEIMEDSKGNIWFGRDGYGATKYDGTTFIHFTKKDGLASNNIRDIVEDKDGSIWFGTRVAEKDHPDFNLRQGTGGLNKYDGEKFTNFPNLVGLNKDDVYEIYQDKKANLWFSTLHNGVYKFNGKTFTNYVVGGSNNTPSKPVVCVLEDSKGIIWIGCSGGLFRLSGATVVNVTTNGPWK